jgi:hypothetical protein
LSSLELRRSRVADLLAWFADYDDRAVAKDVEAMADMAHFPITVVTDDSAGNGVTQVWDRDASVQAMSAVEATC